MPGTKCWLCLPEFMDAHRGLMMTLGLGTFFDQVSSGIRFSLSKVTVNPFFFKNAQGGVFGNWIGAREKLMVFNR